MEFFDSQMLSENIFDTPTAFGVPLGTLILILWAVNEIKKSNNNKN